MLQRWEKVEKELYNKKKEAFDVSKIPDIYDLAKYDLLHNSHLDIPGVCANLDAPNDCSSRSCMRLRRLLQTLLSHKNTGLHWMRSLTSAPTSRIVYLRSCCTIFA